MTKVKDANLNKLLNCDRPQQCKIWTAHDVGMILQTYGDFHIAVPQGKKC